MHIPNTYINFAAYFGFVCAVFIIQILKNEFLSVDDIASKGLKTDDVLSSLTILEIYGFIEALPGGRYKVKE